VAVVMSCCHCCITSSSPEVAEGEGGVCQGGCGWLMTVVGGGGHRQCGEAAAVGEVIMEDVACCGHVGVVAEPPTHEVVVNVWA